MQCASCNYKGEVRNWIILEVSSSDSLSYLIAKKYDKDNGWKVLGGLDLYGCPKCGTIKINV